MASRLTTTYLPESTQLGMIYAPKVPIWISCGKSSSFMFHALIDSGADVNLFPANLAILLNIDLESGRRINVYGIGRHKLQAYEHKIYLHIGKHIFRGVAYFSPENQDPLLGRRGFFDLFKKVSFREKERVVVLGS